MVTLDNGADSGPKSPDELLWNIKTVILKTGLSRASIYRYMKRERFPPPLRVGPNRVAWVPAEVIAWIESRPRLDHRGRRADRGAENRQGIARMRARGKEGSGLTAAPPPQDTNT